MGKFLLKFLSQNTILISFSFWEPGAAAKNPSNLLNYFQSKNSKTNELLIKNIFLIPETEIFVDILSSFCFFFRTSAVMISKERRSSNVDDSAYLLVGPDRDVNGKIKL